MGLVQEKMVTCLVLMVSRHVINVLSLYYHGDVL